MENFTAIEWIAGALIAFTLLKLAVVTVSMPVWLRFASTFYRRPTVTSAISAVLAGGVLYALIGAGVTVIEILAVTVFVALILLVGMAPYGADLIRWAGDRDLMQWLREQWLYSMIWLALILWGLVELVTR